MATDTIGQKQRDMLAKRVFRVLDAVGAKHTTVEHEAVCTVEEEAAVTHKLPGAHTKN